MSTESIFSLKILFFMSSLTNVSVQKGHRKDGFESLLNNVSPEAMDLDVLYVYRFRIKTTHALSNLIDCALVIVSVIVATVQCDLSDSFFNPRSTSVYLIIFKNLCFNIPLICRIHQSFCLPKISIQLPIIASLITCIILSIF